MGCCTSCKLIVYSDSLTEPSGQSSQGTSSVTAKGADGNITEELFVLALLLCSLVLCSVQGSIQPLKVTGNDENEQKEGESF